MTISLKKARDFVYANGVLWEKALFSYFFQEGSANYLHQCLLCYKNPDGGWGHALEHDIKYPGSHPLALEYLLATQRDTAFPIGNLLDNTPAWVERNRQPDGSLQNPADLLDYPHAPWWKDGGQTMPDSITGNLFKLGKCPPDLARTTRQWVKENLTLEKIEANEWLFMAYHAYDYFMNISDFPQLADYRAATINNIVRCTERAPENQYSSLLSFIPSPDSPVAQALPADLLKRVLDYLSAAQQDEGQWLDQHGLRHWQVYLTIHVLVGLRSHGRL